VTEQFRGTCRCDNDAGSGAGVMPSGLPIKQLAPIQVHTQPSICSFLHASHQLPVLMLLIITDGMRFIASYVLYAGAVCRA
jgi:hypothetical protein